MASLRQELEAVFVLALPLCPLHIKTAEAADLTAPLICSHLLAQYGILRPG